MRRKPSLQDHTPLLFLCYHYIIFSDLYPKFFIISSVIILLKKMNFYNNYTVIIIHSHSSGGIMKKLIVILLLLLCAISSSAQTKWFNGSFDEAKALAEKEGKLLLINFSAEW